jgi:hypothetical protein
MRRRVRVTSPANNHLVAALPRGATHSALEQTHESFSIWNAHGPLGRRRKGCAAAINVPQPLQK